MNASYGNVGSLLLAQLKASDFPVITRKVTIAAGNNEVAGSVLGKITATSKYLLSLSAAVDGSQTPDVILLEDVDATAADKEGIAAIVGHWRSDALTIGTGHTADTIREGLRAKGNHIT